jgi:DNA sulfur modification protein DndC
MQVPKNVLFVINHSGGKDSQAMYLYLRRILPIQNFIVVHADLPEVDWPGTIDHIKDTINVELHVVRSKKTFFEMVSHRGMFPSPKNRQCTSDLKRGPIEKKIKEICNANGFDTVINCMGLRSEESPGRSKKPRFRKVNSKTNSKRTWFEWLPIQEWSTDQVFSFIKKNAQKPHWAYAAGMTRLSCCFCIMASKQDLKRASELRPELFNRYVEIERQIDQTMMMPTKKHGRLFLPEIIKGE